MNRYPLSLTRLPADTQHVTVNCAFRHEDHLEVDMHVRLTDGSLVRYVGPYYDSLRQDVASAAISGMVTQ